jgi:hypothetical protein
MRTMLRGKATLLFMMLGLLLAVPTIALADNINDDIADDVASALQLTAGDASSDKTAEIRIVAPTGSGDGNAGCNIDDPLTQSVTLTFNTPAGVTATAVDGATATPGEMKFTACGVFQTVKFSASSAAFNGNYTIDADIVHNTTGTYNNNVSIPITVTGGLTDGDNDGVADGDDNCPSNANTDQADNDGDGIGNACDSTPDGDPNTAPAIASNNATVSVNEGQTASNTGTWSDANAGDTVNLSASVGNVTKNADGTWSWSYGTTDGPDQTQTVTITANDGTATSTTSFSLTVNNVAPATTLSAANPLSVNESSTTEHTYSYTISDPGTDTVSSVLTSCGTNGTKVTGSASNTDTSGSFKCTFDDGNKQSDVSAKATDSDSAAGNEATQSVNIANVAPTATKSFESPVDEGSSFNLALTDPSDPSSADTTAGFTYAFDCGNGYSTFSSSSSTSCSTNDSGTRNVGAKIRDKDLTPVSTYTGTVTVNNVPPTITNITASAQNVLADKNVTFTGTATDPSSVDVTAGFFWQWAVDGGALGTFGTQGNNKFTHSFSDSDCGSHSVSAKAKDKDDGLSDLFTKSNVVNVYSASYNSPLNEGMYNMVQAGRVVPVKISVGCSGNLTGLQPSIQLLKGEQDGGENTSGTDNVETLSVSSADQTGVMRAVDGGYIYNLQVPSTAKANELYTVRVNPFGGSNASSNMYVVLKIRK